MKKILILLVVMVAFTCCTNGNEETKISSDNDKTEMKINKTEHITATVIRVGRYLEQSNGGNPTESGTVLIFDNGNVFKRADVNGAFACAVREGDVLSYDRTPDGKITLTGFVVK